MLDPEIAALMPPGTTEQPPLTADLVPKLRDGMMRQAQETPTPDADALVSEHRTGAIPLRLYRPHGDDPLPLLVFLHGGGWMLGDLDTHDAACRLLAQASGCAVLAVAYRLAPEHPFPAGLDDCRLAFAWARGRAVALGCDPSRVAIGGESAGANLAAALCLALRDSGEAQPAFQLLVHPATNLSWSLPSIDRVSLPGLDRAYLDACADLYLDGHDVADPLVSPLRAADHAGLAPALVFTVEVDPLRDDGERYALALAQAGGEVLLRRLPGLPHGFMILPAGLAAVRCGFDLIGRAVKRYATSA